MAVILLDIEGHDNSASALDRATRGLSNLDQTMGRLSGNSATVRRAMQSQEASYLRLESASLRVQAATDRNDAAQRKAVTTIETHRQSLISLANATTDIAGAQGRAEQAYLRSVTAQERALSSANALRGAYNQLASAQLGVASAGSRMDAALNQPARPPSGGGSGGGGGFSDSYVGQFLKYQVAYSALSDVTNELTQAFQTNIQTQRNFAMTQATTGISSQTNAQLQSYVMQTAGSGKQPFTSDVLSGGLYAIPSAGVTDQAAIKAINDWGVKFSEFTGSKDTQSANTALIQTESEYGIQKSQMAAQAPAIGDAITAMVNLGIVQPNQVAPNVSRFGSTAAQYGVPFGEAAGTFAALTYTAPSADLAALQNSRVIQSIGAPNQAQQKAAAELGVSDLLGQTGMRKFVTDFQGYATELQQAIRLNPGADLKGLYSNRDSVAGWQGLLGPNGGNIQRTIDTISATSQRGTTDKALALYSQSPAAQFDNAQAAFKTSVQTFADAATPFATALTTIGTSGFQTLADLIKGPGGSGGVGASAGGAWNTLAHTVVDAVSGRGLDRDRAAREAGKDQTSGAGLMGGSQLNALGGWFDQHVIGGMKGALGVAAIPLVGPLALTGLALGSMARGAGSAVQEALNTATPPTPRLPEHIVATHGGFENSQTGQWFQTLAQMQAAQHTQVSAAYGADYANDVTRRAYVGKYQLAGIQALQPGVAYGSSAAADAANAASDAATAANQARFDAAHGIGGKPKTAYQDADQRLTLALTQQAPMSTISSALGLTLQSIKDQPGVSGVQKSLQADAERQRVRDYTTAISVDSDQLKVTAAQQNLQAAQMMSKVPSEWKQQEDAYFNSLRQLYRDQYSSPKQAGQLTAALRGVDAQQNAYGVQTTNYGIDRGLQNLQDQLRIDTAHGNIASEGRDRTAIDRFQAKNAAYYGLNAQDIAAQAAETAAAALATIQPTPAPFHQNQQGLGAFGAGDMSTLVRVGGGKDPQAETIKHLQAMLAKDDEEIALLRALVAQGKGGNTARSTGMMTQRGHQR